MVESVMRMDHTKVHNFNFIGRMYTNKKADSTGWVHDVARNRRAWVSMFAEEHFREADVFRNIDGDQTAYSYSTQGGIDEEYYQIMASSNFTLCPSGDAAYSMRFYEAIMAGSIPILNDEDLSAGDAFVACIRGLGYRYLHPYDPLAYQQSWVDENLRLFLSYQTFMFGDLSPPKARCTGGILR